MPKVDLERDSEVLLLSIRRCLWDAHFMRCHPPWAIWILDMGSVGPERCAMPVSRDREHALLWDVCRAILSRDVELSVLHVYAQRLVVLYKCSRQLSTHQRTVLFLFDLFENTTVAERLALLRLDDVCADPWMLTRLWCARGWPDIEVVTDYITSNTAYAEMEHL